MQKSKGFTLLELLITMAIAGILVSIAAPSFTNLFSQNRVASNVNAFLGSVHLARSEAIKTGQNFELCSSSDGQTCANSAEWNLGWIVYEVGTDNVIYVQGSNDKNSITGADSIIFSPSGKTNFQATSSFVFCDNKDTDNEFTKVVGVTQFGQGKNRKDLINNNC